MKAAEECLNKAWPELKVLTETHKRVIEAMKEYAREACKEQREICAAHYNHYTDNNNDVTDQILTAPEPELK